MTKIEFIIKISIVCFVVFLVVAYIFIRNFFKKNYLYSIINKERKLVLAKKLDLNALQDGSWSKNLDEVTSFSSISVAIILLVVAYLIEKELPYYKELYFKIILFVVSIASISYTLSTQLYNNAISRMPLISWTLKQRKTGATFQVIGWYGLITSIMLSITLVDTFLGTVCCFIAALGIMIVYEVKLTEEK